MTLAGVMAVLAGLTGFTGVLLAALGSHAVPGMDELSTYQSWQSANVIHLVHAVVLLVLAIQLRRQPTKLLTVSASLMFLGVVFFSGSIYLKILLSLSGTANVAPMGGIMLMTAWLSLPWSLSKRYLDRGSDDVHPDLGPGSVESKHPGPGDSADLHDVPGRRP